MLKSVINPLDKEALADAKRRTGSAIEVVDDALAAYRRLNAWYQQKRRWTVTLTQSDRLYDLAHRWFTSSEADTAPPRNVKAVMNAAGRRRAAYDDFGVPMTSGQVELLFNESSTRSVVIEGHKVTVQLTQHARPTSGGGNDSNYRASNQDQLSFHALSYDGQQAVITMLRQLAADSSRQKPALHLLSSWGDWNRRDDLPDRAIETVVLKAGQMERLRDDIDTFLHSEDEYIRRGMPYHRGYMLYGPPGTGKTSISRALAAHFGLDLYYAPLGDLSKDGALLSLVSQVKPGSILLLEDIDVYQAARERDADTPNTTTMAGLLNALDGVATPHGLILVMTTNDLDVIDDAIIRPGRVDLLEHIDLPDHEQVVRLYNVWYDLHVDVEQIAPRVIFGGSTAELVSEFRNQPSATEAMVWLQSPKVISDGRPVSADPDKGDSSERHREEGGGKRRAEGRRLHQG